MATFLPAEIEQIWEILNLEAEQLRTDSVFRQLIKYFEDDTEVSDIVVPKIQALLVQYTADEAALDLLRDSGPVNRMRADDEGTVEYAGDASAFTTAEGTLRGIANKIRRWLDPRGLLYPYTLRARTISTV